MIFNYEIVMFYKLIDHYPIENGYFSPYEKISILS